MDIYVNVTDDDGLCTWYNSVDGESYLRDAVDLQDRNTDKFAGTAFATPCAAKAAGKRAKQLANWDGSINPKVKFFTMVKGTPVEIAFTRDGQIRYEK